MIRGNLAVYRLVQATVAGLLGLGAVARAAEPAVDFSRDVRPILSDNCYACHGPDENKLKAGLRLDLREQAVAELSSGGHAIVPGRSAESLLIERVATEDEIDRMPPARTGKKLTDAQIDLLRKWIDQGADYKQHWSFIRPQRHEPPQVDQPEWTRNAIDHFILRKLQENQLTPSPEADRATLIRRATLDLTGLPPTIEEVDAFVNDASPDAYEKLIDRLLASPHYGERKAHERLDIARNGDTNGYHYDSDRSMWPYRDYVIKSFNENKPYDQFTIESLAGDLLPDPTVEQKIASGFNRNVTYNEEGGADPDEYIVKYAVDRASTTGTVYLGLTLGCAECHDHKYDPITQKEFYQFYAFFNNVPEDGAQGHDQPHPPVLKLPSEEQKKELADVRAALAGAEASLKERPEKAAADQAAWEQTARQDLADSSVNQGLVAHYELDASDNLRVAETSGHYRHGVYVGGEPKWVPGKAGKALQFDGQGGVVEIAGAGDFERTDAFSFGCFARPEGSGGVLIARMNEAQAHRGYDVGIVDGRIWVHILNAWPDNALKVTTKAIVPAGQWHHIMVTYDGSSKAGGLKVYLNGTIQPVEVNSNNLPGTIRPDVPLHIGKRHASFPFHGAIDDVRIYDRFLTEAEVARLAGPAALAGTLAVAPQHRTPEEQQALRTHYLDNFDAEYARLKQQVADLTRRRDELDKSLNSTLVMSVMEPRRPAFVLVRGDFQQKGEEVQPDVPSIFPRLPEDQPRSRLTLAKWLVSEDNPLTARVAVNRFWIHLFGTGLVKTGGDFGSQGEAPSHPELLDWLTTEFIRSGWDIKYLYKLIMTSATYRQSSLVRDKVAEHDPQNRLLYRTPRLRLSAEQVRDNALAISGLLNDQIGGPSVFPYQPEGYYGDKGRWKWPQSHGRDLHRRGLYTFWRRTTFYPSFQMFDAPSREFCTVERPRTITPLQALVTLNDPAFVEAARVFGQRIMEQGGRELDDRLVFAFRTALARHPTARELEVLAGIYRKQHERYFVDIPAALELVDNGEAPRPAEIDFIDLAAWTATANVILNLDETITRE